MAWIGYRKAFDTTSHELIVRLLGCLSVDNQIMECIKHLIPLWKTLAEVEMLLNLLKDKPMHEVFHKHLEEHGLFEQLTFSLLRSSVAFLNQWGTKHLIIKKHLLD
nr:unnamed protein product [Callosobruchus analis]